MKRLALVCALLLLAVGCGEERASKPMYYVVMHNASGSGRGLEKHRDVVLTSTIEKVQLGGNVRGALVEFATDAVMATIEPGRLRSKDQLLAEIEQTRRRDLDKKDVDWRRGTDHANAFGKITGDSYFSSGARFLIALITDGENEPATSGSRKTDDLSSLANELERVRKKGEVRLYVLGLVQRRSQGGKGPTIRDRWESVLQKAGFSPLSENSGSWGGYELGDSGGDPTAHLKSDLGMGQID